MKFIHIADMHFDCLFSSLIGKGDQCDLRRLDQRKIFKKMIDYIKENNVEYLFISGDLYEHKYIRKSTIEYINKLFIEIPNTKIFISPGNHDPYVENSYYNKFNWSKNVKIFSGEIEKIEEDNLNVYGFGFNDFYCENSKVDMVNLDDKNKLNILVIHGNLDIANIQNMEYNPLKSTILEEKGFDYVALGHIHKTNYIGGKNDKIIYPGSMMALGFDEVGRHGMIVGEFIGKELSLEFVSLDDKEYKVVDFDVSNIFSKEELIEKVNDMKIKDNEYIEIVLVGNRSFEINIYDILKLISNDNVIKLKNQTKVGYDLDKLSNETTLKGLFIKAMNEKLKDENLQDREKEIIEKAIEIGLDVLE